jgi:WD40 repeat protein
MLRQLTVTRLKVGATLLLALGLLAVGAGLAVSRAWEATPSDPEQPATAGRAGQTDPGEGRQPRADRLGDPLPAGAVARIGSVRWWQGGGAEGPLVFTPDGKLLVSCEADQAVRLLDAATGQEVRRLRPPGDAVFSFALAPDGKTLATADLRSPVVRLWDVATGKELRQLRGDAGGTSVVAFAPDGKTFAAANPSTVIRLWNVATWQESGRLTGHTGWISSVVLLPDGKTLISGAADGTIRWWDMGTGRKVRRLRQNLPGRISLCASPDGKRLATVETPCVLHLWDAATGAEVSRTVLGDEREYRCLAFSPDSQTLAVGNGVGRRGNQTVFFAAATGRELRRWNEDGYTSRLAFSPDGKVLAQASDRVRLRDAVTEKPVGEMPGLPDRALSVTFAPDGKALTVSCWGGLTGSWDPLAGRHLGPLHAPPRTFAGRAEMLLGTALTAGGGKAALVDAEAVLHVWEPATGKEWCRIAQPPVGEDQADLSADGKLVVVKHRDQVIRVWDAETGKLRHSLPRFGENRFPHPHAFSPDGRVLATAPGSLDESVIRLWDTATGKPVGRLAWQDSTSPTCLRFTADGKYLVAAHGEHLDPGQRQARGDPGVRLWDLATGREVRRLRTPAGEIRAMALSPDGKTVAAAAHNTVVLWELASGQERGRFTGHREWVWSLAFSPDGRLLASGSLDYTALVWDVTGLCPDGTWVSRDLGAEEVERLWTDLGGTDGVRAHRALWTMAAAPRRSVPFLAGHLRPVAPVEDERLTRLIADLDSDRFEVRDRASQELQRLGDRAGPALRRALAGKPSPEARRRLEALRGAIESRTLSAEQLHALRAVEVLEHIGTRPARRVLEELAAGAPGALLTDEAKASLQRLAGRAAGADGGRAAP